MNLSRNGASCVATRKNKSTFKRLLLSTVIVPTAALTGAAASAQEESAQTDANDVIVVTGSRRVIQDSIDLKRNSAQIVDGLSADEIGDLPALSIGEALENITGVASHRENGGATEVSIRGLGPYLSSTVVNGRAATNGSGDRSVNFSQFPSELMNKLAVFKTQDASQIEGGVAGQIQLETIKPLDFGKRRIQFEAKGNVNPDQLNQSDTEAGDIGYRLTGSYTDQFEVGGSEFGLSIGVQRSDISQPEAESRQTGPTSNSRPACLITDGLDQYTDQTFGGTFTGFSNNPETEDRGDDDCDDFNDRRNPDNLTQRGSDTEGVDTTLVNGVAVDAGTPFAFAPSQRHFRQNDTRDERDAIFGAFQWRPNPELEFNVDVQWSERKQSERRNDLTFNGGRRNDTSLNIGPDGTTTTLDSLVTTPEGGILRAITDNTIEVQGGDWQREETYIGGGLNVAYDVSERLTLSADVAYSETERSEQAKEFRIQSNISPVIEFDRTDGRNVPLYTLYDEVFDVNDHANYVDRLRVRIDNDVFRENTIMAARFDADYVIDNGFFTTLEAGFRWSEQDYLELPGGADSGDPFNVTSGRFSLEIEDNTDLNINNRQVVDGSGSDTTGLASSWVDIIASVNTACQTQFPEGNSFLSSQRAGDLVTNIADDGSVISSTNSWATFDATCVANTAVDSLNAILDQINLAIADRGDVDDPLSLLSSDIPGLNEINSRTIDVEEVTQAFYAMTGYETRVGDFPVFGNIGVRVVRTEVEATGYRPDLTVTETDGVFTIAEGDLVPVTLSHDYTTVLPSANAIVEIAEDKLLRFGVFRALSRPDPADMGFGRSINVIGDDEDATSLEDLIQNITANGNPAIDPLTSWNFDAGFEWYPNEDSIFAVSAYYKIFQGGFENVIANETYTLNGQDVQFPVAVQQTSEETSNLFGIEVTAAHRFSYLPGFLSGLGAKISYNYVDSNFEFEDSRYGDLFTRQLDGTVVQTNEGIIAPGGLPGLSENTLSAQVYYQIGDLDLQVNYKYRDSYFQPFVSDGTRLRFVGDVGVWEARASYNVTDNVRLSAEAINIFSAPKEQFAFVSDDLYEVNDYGPRLFFGVRGRF